MLAVHVSRRRHRLRLTVRTVEAVEVAELLADACAEGEPRVRLHPRQPAPQRQLAQRIVLNEEEGRMAVPSQSAVDVSDDTSAEWGLCARIDAQSTTHAQTDLGAGAGLLVGEERQHAPLQLRKLPQPLRHLRTHGWWG